MNDPGAPTTVKFKKINVPAPLISWAPKAAMMKCPLKLVFGITVRVLLSVPVDVKQALAAHVEPPAG